MGNSKKLTNAKIKALGVILVAVITGVFLLVNTFISRENQQPIQEMSNKDSKREKDEQHKDTVNKVSNQGGNVTIGNNNKMEKSSIITGNNNYQKNDHVEGNQINISDANLQDVKIIGGNIKNSSSDTIKIK